VFSGILFFVCAYPFWIGSVLPSNGWSTFLAILCAWLFIFGLFLGGNIAETLGLGKASDPGFNSAYLITLGIMGLIVAHIGMIAYCSANPKVKAFLNKA